MANFSLSMPNFRAGGASGAVGGAAGNTDVAGLHSSAVAAMPRVDLSLIHISEPTRPY